MASKLDALHTFWWVQETNGRAILSAGPQSYRGGSNPYIEAWVVPGNSNATDNSGQHLVFNTGVSSDVCGQVDSMINSASQFPRRSIYYNPVWGPTATRLRSISATRQDSNRVFHSTPTTAVRRVWCHNAVAITLGFTRDRSGSGAPFCVCCG